MQNDLLIYLIVIIIFYENVQTLYVNLNFVFTPLL